MSEPNVNPRSFSLSLIHCVSTGPVVWPALEPGHMPLVLCMFSFGPEPFSYISIISKALQTEYSPYNKRVVSSAY